MSESPKFSIVTITKDNEAGLRATFQSVASQSDQNFELIVIDGHSCDGTKELVQEFKAIVTRFEEDSGAGIYAAMNQGVASCRGDWVIFMNSGDIFSDDKVLERFEAPPKSVIAFGKTRKPDGSPHTEFLGWENIWKRMPFCHQAAFVRRSLLLDHPFNERYNIAADFEFVLWAHSEACVFHQLDYNVAQIEEGGISDTAIFKRIWQTYRVVLPYFPQWKVHSFYFSKLKWAFRRQYFSERRRK